MAEPLTVAALRQWLADLERTYGPDVPLYLVSPGHAGGRAPAWALAGLRSPPRVPIVDLLLDYGGGRPAVLFLAQPGARNGEGPP